MEDEERASCPQVEVSSLEKNLCRPLVGIVDGLVATCLATDHLARSFPRGFLGDVAPLFVPEK